MPAAAPPPGPHSEAALRQLGGRLRERRKQLGLTVQATAEAAGMSRVTLQRIERGHPSVTMGAWISAASALGLTLELTAPEIRGRLAKQARAALPREIRPEEHPGLKKLAWQLRPGTVLTPKEALDLYERNWRHVDVDALDDAERALLTLLLEAFGRERLLV